MIQGNPWLTYRSFIAAFSWYQSFQGYQSTAIMDPTKNTIENGPAPDFFVVGGIVVTGGCVIAGVTIIVGSEVVVEYQYCNKLKTLIRWVSGWLPLAPWTALTDVRNTSSSGS